MRALDRPGGGRAAPSCPVATSPVSDTIATFGWLISALPTVSPRPTTTLRTPAGKMSATSARELQRRQRRLLGRLEDDGVAAGERRRELPRRHHQRVVPRRDRADDADRIAPDHRGMAGQVLARRRAMHGAHRAGEEAEAVDDRRHLVVQHADARLAAVQRLERGERLGLAFDGVGELQQQRRALRRRRARPGREGLLRGVDGRVDLLKRGFREARRSPPRSSD